MALDIDAAAMPPGEGINGQSMTKVVDTRSMGIAGVA